MDAQTSVTTGMAGTTPARRLVHDLGNLLSIVMGQAEYLLHEIEDIEPSERRQSLESIRRAAMGARDSLRQLSQALREADTGPSLTAAAATLARRILVIDDEEDVRDTLTELLRQAGYEVVAATSGTDGVQLYRGQRFDCVVTDMGMPGINGLTVSRAIKDHDPHAYVVLLTGVELDRPAEELRAAGVDRVMVKPLTRSEILDMVRRSA